MTIGERIYYCRTENHMTQKQLAEKCGMADSAIRKYESGKITPKIGTLRKIADALGVSVTTLMGYEDGMEKAKKEAQQAAEEAKRKEIEAKQAVRSLLVSMSIGQDDGKLIEAYNQLNDDGKRVACERVQELTQILKYRRQDAPQDAPGGTDDKESTQK